MVVIAATVGAPVGAAADPPPGSTTLISRRLDGGFPGGGSGQPAISENGRWVAFASAATDLVPNDLNRALDVFVHDRRSGTTIRLPGPAGGPLPLGTSGFDPSIAADGSVVAFTVRSTSANALLAAPVLPIVVAWNRATGKTKIVSVAQDGAVARGSGEASVSGDGRLIAYTSTWPAAKPDLAGLSDVFVRDRVAKTTTLVSQARSGGFANAASRAPAISRDGRLVAFASAAGNLTNGDDNGQIDVFVRALAGSSTSLVSVARNGTANGPSTNPAISADGRFVAFESAASNLVSGPPPGSPAVYRRDRVARTTALASVAESGAPFPGASRHVSISRDGRIMAFSTTETKDRSEVYAHDAVSGETILVSVAAAGGPGGSLSITPAIGGNGRYVAFASDSARILVGDDNRVPDVFLRDLPPVPIIDPGLIDFGFRSVGMAGLPGAATLRNDGWGPLTGGGGDLAGSAAADYSIVFDGCAVAVLHRSEACSTSVAFDPSATGSRKGTLRIDFGAPGSPGVVRLTGRVGLATVDLDPPLGPPGIVTVATGSGFPPETEVRLAWSRGISPLLPTIVTDADGAFQIGVLVFHNDIVGERELVAGPAAGESFLTFGTRFLVVTAKSQPPRFIGQSAFGGAPQTLVMRR
jgi:Tol biopolymer transport system component